MLGQIFHDNHDNVNCYYRVVMESLAYSNRKYSFFFSESNVQIREQQAPCAADQVDFSEDGQTSNESEIDSDATLHGPQLQW